MNENGKWAIDTSQLTKHVAALTGLDQDFVGEVIDSISSDEFSDIVEDGLVREVQAARRAQGDDADTWHLEDADSFLWARQSPTLIADKTSMPVVEAVGILCENRATYQVFHRCYDMGTFMSSDEARNIEMYSGQDLENVIEIVAIATHHTGKVFGDPDYPYRELAATLQELEMHNIWNEPPFDTFSSAWSACFSIDSLYLGGGHTLSYLMDMGRLAVYGNEGRRR